jgi:vancomycin resistance protein YoaR
MRALKHKPEIYVIAAFLVLSSIISAWIIISSGKQGYVSKHIYLAGRDLKGASYTQISDIIATKKAELEKSGLIIKHADQKSAMMSEAGNPESGLIRDNFSISLESTLAELKQRNELRWSLKKTSGELKYSYKIDENNIKDSLAEKFSGLEIKPEDAKFYVQNGAVKISTEKIGQQIDYGQAIEDIKNRLATGRRDPVEISTFTAYPNISSSSLSPFLEQATSYLDRKISVSYGAQSWQIYGHLIISWLYADNSNGTVKLEINEEKIKEYITEQIAPKIDRAPELPKFEISGNKVTSWKNGKDGIKTDIEKTAANIKSALDNGQDKADLIVETINPESLSESGISIKEIIGTGHSNFSGSSASRRHNIETGATALQGLLIKPDEEFSLVKALGNIDASGGYLPELVIKENKTVPEYGGGLCQIGTTMFRTALASGLPITERRNHSYRVSYYEPAGTDATIYDPSPDFKFKNDTGNYILIQYRIEGTDIYFDFWGTNDGRIATTTYPIIYNIVKPEPTKIIETTDLAPGEKKCTESSHNGADAYFDYSVTYPATSSDAQPEIKERRFSSHYVPWQGVCLIGTSTIETMATGTTSIMPETINKEQ